MKRNENQSKLKGKTKERKHYVKGSTVKEKWKDDE